MILSIFLFLALFCYPSLVLPVSLLRCSTPIYESLWTSPALYSDLFSYLPFLLSHSSPVTTLSNLFFHDRSFLLSLCKPFLQSIAHYICALTNTACLLCALYRLCSLACVFYLVCRFLYFSNFSSLCYFPLMSSEYLWLLLFGLFCFPLPPSYFCTPSGRDDWSHRV